LTFADTTNIDKNYSCLTKAINFTADGDNTTAKVCVDGKCECASPVTSGSSIVYVYTTALSNYLISFSLILSALTLSL
jgi:hypothetical protein